MQALAIWHDAVDSVHYDWIHGSSRLSLWSIVTSITSCLPVLLGTVLAVVLVKTLYTAFLGPLSSIPAAHWSCRYVNFWIGAFL